MSVLSKMLHVFIVEYIFSIKLKNRSFMDYVYMNLYVCFNVNNSF